MSLEDNKAIVRKLMEAVNKKDFALLDELVVPNYANPTMGIQSREEFKRLLSAQYGGFPDVYREMEDIIAEGDKVWIRVKITGTNTGEYRGLAPTGKKFVMAAVPTYRIANGKIIEGWSVFTSLNLLKGKKLFPEK
jgi:predicted ester cyclase